MEPHAGLDQDVPLAVRVRNQLLWRRCWGLLQRSERGTHRALVSTGCISTIFPWTFSRSNSPAGALAVARRDQANHPECDRKAISTASFLVHVILRARAFRPSRYETSPGTLPLGSGNIQAGNPIPVR
uniref:(northern house mosquito) hypothetical protein n=1 Tax=Culex pipiens TaxID=7175 RepID=A0A8D8FWI6_CULPI